MHKSARERASQRGELTSKWSDLFMKIGEVARGEPADEPDEPNDDFRNLFGSPVLPVTLWDLRHLTDAVDATALGPDCDYSVDDALIGWNAEASGQSLPERKQLPLVFEISWKQLEDTDSESERSTVSRQGSFLSSRLRPAGDDGSEIGDTFDDNFEEEAEPNNGYSPTTPALWVSARDGFDIPEALPQQPSTTSPGNLHQNSRLLMEISELRRENRELQNGQQRLYKLMEESQKQHNESMASIQAQLRELVEANHESNL
ncbi:hypothetical protein H9Q70_005033 [Fusarium xylarioides]|nr:hypothetical protein H9Q70_005033 [Fusarium xylarioides]